MAEVDRDSASATPADVPDTAPSALTAAYLVVALLATGLTSIEAGRSRQRPGRRVASTRSVTTAGLLPAPWRSAVSRIWWHFHLSGVTPPADDLELFELCRTPFSEWPAPLPLSDSDADATLLDGDELTPLARQAARIGIGDTEADFVEEQAFAALRATVELNGADDDQRQAGYEWLRRFLIEEPVITDKRLRELLKRFPAPGASGQPYVHQLVSAAYERRDAPRSGRVVCCSACGNLLAAEVVRCRAPGCQGLPSARELDAFDACYVQHRGVRRFIHDAGLLDLRMYAAARALVTELGEAALMVQVWPGLDTFDVLVAFMDPANPGCTEPVEVWGADGKDHESPTLLAMTFHWNHAIACDRRFLVLPMHRAKQPGYVADLETELQGRDSRVTVIDEEQFVRRIAARAKEIAQS